MRKIVLVSIITLFALSNSLLAQEHHQDNKNHLSPGSLSEDPRAGEQLH